LAGSSLRRAASTHPALPPPTTIQSDSILDRIGTSSPHRLRADRIWGRSGKLAHHWDPVDVLADRTNPLISLNGAHDGHPGSSLL
jgi:hypothetical protein